MKSKTDLMIPCNHIVSGSTGAVMTRCSKAGRRPTKFQNFLRQSEKVRNITCKKYLSMCLSEIDRRWRPFVAGGSRFHKPRCCRRARWVPRIPEWQILPHLAMLRWTTLPGATTTRLTPGSIIVLHTNVGRPRWYHFYNLWLRYIIFAAPVARVESLRSSPRAFLALVGVYKTHLPSQEDL